MKNTILFLVSALHLGLLLPACNKNDSGLVPPNTGTTSQAQTSPVPSGNFTLRSYRQKNDDRTHLFDGYVFTFTSTGTNTGNVLASKGSSAVSGTWLYSPAVTYYGSTSKTSITLNLGTASPFILLNKTWNVGSTSTASDLALSSPELAEDEHVVFAKQ